MKSGPTLLSSSRISCRASIRASIQHSSGSLHEHGMATMGAGFAGPRFIMIVSSWGSSSMHSSAAVFTRFLAYALCDGASSAMIPVPFQASRSTSSWSCNSSASSLVCLVLGLVGGPLPCGVSLGILRAVLLPRLGLSCCLSPCTLSLRSRCSSSLFLLPLHLVSRLWGCLAFPEAALCLLVEEESRGGLGRCRWVLGGGSARGALSAFAWY